MQRIRRSDHNRPEGVRVKHYLSGNSIKMYDKAGSVLRVETTIGNPKPFKVFRPKQDATDGQYAWRPLRKGTADLHRRAEVSQRANDTYLDALGAVSNDTPASEVFDQVARHTTWRGRRARALRIGDPGDIALFKPSLVASSPPTDSEMPTSATCSTPRSASPRSKSSRSSPPAPAGSFAFCGPTD